MGNEYVLMDKIWAILEHRQAQYGLRDTNLSASANKWQHGTCINTESNVGIYSSYNNTHDFNQMGTL